MRLTTPGIYFEHRRPSAADGTGLAVDIARHLQQRQFLGAAVVVCDNPHAILSAVRKKWLAAMRLIQVRRASSLNAEIVAKLSQTVTHMSRLTFWAGQPTVNPGVDVYFLRPSELGEAPHSCYTLYIASRFGSKTVKEFCWQLPPGAVAVVYGNMFDPSGLHWLPKERLEEQMLNDWQKLDSTLTASGVLAGNLTTTLRTREIDSLLGRISRFQNMLALCRPLVKLDEQTQKGFESLADLSARLLNIKRSAFNDYFLSNLDKSEAMDYFPFSASSA